jgi:hypothetical protein
MRLFQPRPANARRGFFVLDYILCSVELVVMAFFQAQARAIATLVAQ